MSLSGAYHTAVDDLVALATPLVARMGSRGRLVAVAEGDGLALYDASGAGEPKRLPPSARRKAAGALELRLPAESVLRRSLTLPAAGRDYLEPIIEHRLDRLVPWTPDRAVYGYRVTGETEGGELEVEFAATSRDIVETWTARAAKAGLEPTALGSLAEPLERPLELDLWRGARDRVQAKARTVVRKGAIAAALLIVPMLALSLYASWSAEERLAGIEARSTAARRALQQAAGAGAGSREAELIAAKRPEAAMMTFVDRLARVIPSDTVLRDLEVDEGRIRMAGSSAGAPALIGLLEQSGLMRDTRFAAPVTRAPDGRDNFEILAQRLRPDTPQRPGAAAEAPAPAPQEPRL